MPEFQSNGAAAAVISADVQSARDHRKIAINQVGVSDLRYPIVILDRAKTRQHTIARSAMSVNLPHYFKGTHISRFLEVLNQHWGEITVRMLPKILQALTRRLQAKSAHLEVTIPYFLEKAAPQTGAIGLMNYDCSLTATRVANSCDLAVGVRVPVTSPY